jgi:hypothetical protein
MLDALPWVVSTIVLVVLVILGILHTCKRARALTPSRAAARARLHRQTTQEATEASLERIGGAMESDNAEELIAAEANRASEDRQS